MSVDKKDTLKPVTRNDIIFSAIILIIVLSALAYPVFWEYTNKIGSFDNGMRSGNIVFNYEWLFDGKRYITSVGHGTFIVGDSFNSIVLNRAYYAEWHYEIHRVLLIGYTEYTNIRSLVLDKVS